LTEQEGFEAMRYFLTEFWKRAGHRAHGSAELDRAGGPGGREDHDPTQWHDWLDAVKAVRAGAA
jgi:hypothetical protein